MLGSAHNMGTQHDTHKMMTSQRRNNGNYGHRQVIVARRRLNGVNRKRNAETLHAVIRLGRDIIEFNYS